MSWNRIWKHLLALRCGEATQLMCDSHDRKLSRLERWGLSAHMAICSACRRAQKQFAAIEAAARKLSGRPVLTADESAAAQERIANRLRETLSDPPA